MTHPLLCRFQIKLCDLTNISQLKNALEMIEKHTSEANALNQEEEFKKDFSHVLLGQANKDNNVTEAKQPGAKTKKQIDRVETFNRLMFALAKRGDTKRIIWCFNRMNALHLKPNLESYVAALISVGKHPAAHRATVMRIIMDCKKSNLNVLELATSIDYSSEQMSCIKNALDLVYPGFEFVACQDLTRTHPLLSKLKSTSENSQGANVTNAFCQELSDRKTILENFESQIKIEKKFLIEVPSIYEETKLDSEKSEQYKGYYNKKFREQVTKNFASLIEQLSISKTSNDKFILPFLLIMDKSVYVDLIMKEIEILAKMSEFFSSTFANIGNEIGKRVENRFQKYCLSLENDFEKIQTNYGKYIDYVMQKYADHTTATNSHREEWMDIMRRDELFTVIDNLNFDVYEGKNLEFRIV